MDEERNRPLTVITGGRKTREPRAVRRRALHHNEQITCWCCENEIGIATSMAVRVMLAPRRAAGWCREPRIGFVPTVSPAAGLRR